MTPQISYSHTKLDKAMTNEQFEQVVEAILAGKYSWACVLILRFAGYNPLHYIPYRTYNRLLKENCQIGSSHKNKTDSINRDSHSAVKPDGLSSREKCLTNITDLAYLEAIEDRQAQISGGNLEHVPNSMTPELSPPNFDLNSQIWCFPWFKR